MDSVEEVQSIRNTLLRDLVRASMEDDWQEVISVAADLLVRDTARNVAEGTLRLIEAING
jgi:hypothetical protein